MTARPVPLFDLGAQHAEIETQVSEAVARVMARQDFVRGPEVEGFEKLLADYCGAGHGVACGSGTDALLLSLMAEGIGPGDRVICPAFSFFSTASVVKRLGAEIVFADLDPKTLCVGAEQVESALGRDGPAAALIAVHLFGASAPMDELLDLSRKDGMTLIEDAAQAIDARDDSGQPVGTRGDYGCFSFYPTKNLGAYGDGGIILTNDPERSERLRRLRDHGEGPAGEHPLLGINSRLDGMQAAILSVKLRHLPRWTNLRQTHAATYNKCLDDLGAGVGAGRFEALDLPVRRPLSPVAPARHVYHHYVVRVPAEHRDSLRTYLTAAQIGTGLYYPVPLHLQPSLAGQGAPLKLPVAEAAAKECLALPVHPSLSTEQVHYVVDEIRSYFAG
ncbi:MAG: DegT/DnrJ/EryC1/StrS family aminotransferase [Myxococcota bacterium]|nr:DegT/DnrJ/EryC1/StrS family aminotransferase [Myxococcota bacterium]